MAYSGAMVIIETPVFTRQVQALLPDEDYHLLQQALVARPEAGQLIPGTHGLRKLRWGLADCGKRGGARIIYYWDAPADRIYMLFAYRKSVQEDLTPAQVKMLGVLVKEWLR